MLNLYRQGQTQQKPGDCHGGGSTGGGRGGGGTHEDSRSAVSGEAAVAASALFPLPNALSGGRRRRGVGAGIWCRVLLETTE